MASYTIKELENLSGIKSHTIRIWEKRYNLLTPERTQTNIRTYTDDQLKKLLNIALLNQNGYKISYIAQASPVDLEKKLQEILESPSDYNSHISQLTSSMITLDEVYFEKTLSDAILKYGFEDTMLHIVYPFLDKIGILWLSNKINPAQEHFISNLIRQKIIVAIDALPIAPEESDSYLLFLPEHELHEIGLLVYSYLLKKNKKKVIYLGQSVPFSDLIKVQRIKESKYFLTSFIISTEEHLVHSFVEKIKQNFPEVKTLVSGTYNYIFKEHKEHFLTFNNILEFKKML